MVQRSAGPLSAYIQLSISVDEPARERGEASLERLFGPVHGVLDGIQRVLSIALLVQRGTTEEARNPAHDNPVGPGDRVAGRSLQA